LRVETSESASAFTSASVIPGSSAFESFVDASMPVSGSPFRYERTMAAAIPRLSVFSRSA